MKGVVKIVYYYKDGHKESIEGPALKKYKYNIGLADTIILSHGGGYKEFKWRKENDKDKL